MFAQPIKKHLRRLALAAVALAAVIITYVNVFMAREAFARIRTITNEVGIVSAVIDKNRQLILTGQTVCDAGETAEIRVTVTQRSTGAVAEGGTRITCTGDHQQWVVRAPTDGKQPFAEGSVTVVYFIRTFYREDSTDAHQWLEDVPLKKQ